MDGIRFLKLIDCLLRLYQIVEIVYFILKKRTCQKTKTGLNIACLRVGEKLCQPLVLT